MTPKSTCRSIYTPRKQKMLMRLFNATLQNCNKKKPFVWVDSTAGLPIWDIPKFGPCFGSSVIGYQLLKGLPDLIGYLFEGAAIHFEPLEEYFDKYADDRITLQCTDNKRAAKLLARLHAKDNGLLYYDPEGFPSMGTPLAMGLAAPNMEVLCHISASFLKRAKAKAAAGQNVKPELLMMLDEYVNKLGRKRNFISDCREKQQWCFLLSTNNESYSPPSGMLDITSKEGKILFDYLCSTKAEDEAQEEDMTELKAIQDNPALWATIK